jgi:hypothetical protein
MPMNICRREATCISTFLCLAVYVYAVYTHAVYVYAVYTHAVYVYAVCTHTCINSKYGTILSNHMCLYIYTRALATARPNYKSVFEVICIHVYTCTHVMSQQQCVN